MVLFLMICKHTDLSFEEGAQQNKTRGEIIEDIRNAFQVGVRYFRHGVRDTFRKMLRVN